jgi:RHS repeat-associated protein
MRLAKIVGSSVHYYHKDHLGSSALVTDSGGNLVDSIVYEPYGRTRQTCQITSGDVAYSYTDQEWDAETGLYNYDARLYDPVLGRFIGADSVVPDWYDPQALDRFAYARNNPLKYIDPDGHFFTPETIWDAANIGIGIASLYSNIKSGSWGSAVVDAVGVALDTGAAVIPIIPGGVSAGIKAGRLADKAVDTARAVDNVADALKAPKSIPKVSPTVSELRQLGVKGFQAHHGLPEYLGKMLGYTSKQMAEHPGILVSQFRHTGKLNPNAIHKAISKYLPPSTRFKKVNYSPQQIRQGLQKAYNDLGMPEMYKEIAPLIK